jgi:type IV secretion system protein VirB6
MNPWHIFAPLYQSFNTPFLAAVNGLATNLIGELGVLATAAATIYIAVTFSLDLFGGGGGNPVLDLVRRCGRVALILSALTVANYTGTIVNLLMTTLPASLAAAVTGGTPVGAGAFDVLGGQMWAAVSQVFNNVSIIEPKSMVLAIFAGLYAGYSTVAIALCFSLWMITQVGLGLVVVVGPLAIVCLIIPQTVRYFNGWLSCIVSFIVSQLMIVVVISLLLATVNSTLAQILAGNGAGGANANDLGNQVHQILNAGLMFTVAAILSLSVVPIARAIGGGAAAELSPVSRWANSKIGAGHAAVGGAAVSGARAAGSAFSSNAAAGLRSIKPVGKAIG